MTDRNGQKAAKEQRREAAPLEQSAGRPRRRSTVGEREWRLRRCFRVSAPYGLFL